MTESFNVVRLPTAPKRKVQQNFNRRAREARQALRAEQGREFPWCHPQVRAAKPEAALLLEMQRTPELAMALAMWRALPAEVRYEADKNLRIMALTSKCAEQAAALVKQRTVGESIDLDAALALLNGGLSPC